MFSVSRPCLTRLLSRLGTTATGRWSHGSAGVEGGVYELRVYSVKPDMFAAFSKLKAAKFHLRLAYTKPLGYWLSDLGGIFQAVHIWPYDSVSHRAKVRGAMAQDKVWQDEFFSSFLSCVDRLDNSLMVTAPGSAIRTEFSPSPTAVYELWSLPVSDADDVTALTESPDETLVGRFRTVYGDTGTEYRLMRYPDADTAFTHARDRAGKTKKVRGYSRFMVPHDCSPIK
ncbi:protein NipSnap homolog 3B-like [Littorina saxatilis]|uniref:protein NipSnap homolog 3B-like n=1 Tax=Littorina saxatilis TaxID=31220 RepID=UPI0038B632D9